LDLSPFSHQTRFLQQIQGGQQIWLMENEMELGNRTTGGAEAGRKIGAGTWASVGAIFLLPSSCPIFEGWKKGTDPICAQ
jgi:hypothetical protein